MTDFRYALRQLRKSPLFTLVAALTLTLGIGANTAIFTLFDQVMIRSLPVSHPEQLVRLRYTGESPGHTNTYGGDDADFFSYPMYRDLRDRNSVFSGLVANDEQTVGVEWNNRSEVADAELVSGNYFQVLGLQPAMGRLLLPSDDLPASSPAVVLSFNYWKTGFGSDPRVMGQTLEINAHPFTIVGVTLPEFHSVVAGATPKVFVPVSAKNTITPRWQDLENRESHWLTLAGRLKPGENRRQAQAGLEPLWHSLRAEELKLLGYHSQRTRRLFLDDSHILLLDNARGFSPLRDEQLGTPLLIVMGMVGLLLLMACINVSSLLLVRAAGRAREMSVRYAMGAGRRHIVRQLLLEGVLLGLLGGTFGLAMAPAVAGALVRLLFTDPAATVPLSTQPDMRVLVFNFGIALAASILFSLAPALRFLRPDLVNSLKQQTGTASGGPLRFRRISVGAQIGVSLLLLIGAGLFVRTLRNLRAVDVGFVSDHMVSFEVNGRLAGYESAQLQPLNRRILDTLAALPGVRAVAATNDPDLTGNEETGNVSIAGYRESEAEDMRVEEPWVTPEYFATMSVPVLAGRPFSSHDVSGQNNVAMVNASFARHYFGNAQGAIGRVLKFGSGAQSRYDTEIVGVVGDTRHTAIRDPVRRTVYRPLLQSPELNGATYLVRTWQAPQTTESEIRTAMQQLDSRLVLNNLQTVDEQIANGLANERLIALLSVSFGILAVVLAAIGLYGVLTYSTAQRTREIGIRMAMGAQRAGVMRLVLRDVLWIAGISIAVTLPLSLLLGWMLRTELYGVGAADPPSLLAGTLLVTTVAMLSALLPARRAASIEPMQALRTE
ncbi:MAG TPA: ABC transporter permease [Candidatus Binatia bacterium]|nr:ABC transporter permease [Candidatus Binatia bacterium]